MTRKLFGPLLVLLASTATLAADATAPAITDALHPLPPGAVRLEGDLGRQLESCLAGRIRTQDVEHLLQPFRDRRDTTEWRSEFWGKWFTSAVAGWRYTPEESLAQRLDRAAAGLLATQTADGYIGSYPDGGRRQRWDIWGRKYTLLGLLAWHEQTGDEALLTAARRQADLLIEEVGPGRASPFENDMWHGMASSSVLEPMVLLYRRTGRPDYLAFADYLVEQWATPAGPDLLRKALAGTPVFAMFDRPKPDARGYGDAGKSKAYEMMSCYEGLAELYRTTGQAEYGDAVLKVYDNIRETELTVVGSGSDWERWCDGRRRQTEPWQKGMETCVTVTWIKFAALMLRLTGDSRYADDIELSALNALAGAQGLDGAWWCHHTPLAGIKERAPKQCGMEQNCCVANGPRGLMLLPQLAVMSGATGPVINFYGPSNATAALPGGGSVRLVISGDYPRAETVRITVEPEQPAEFAVLLRIPAWSTESRLTVQGETQSVQPGTYAAIARLWRPGDVIELSLDLRARLVTAPGDATHTAIVRGPLVLARDRRLGDSEIDAPVALQAGKDGVVELRASEAPDGIAMVFEAPTQVGGTVRVCDFASAGNTWSDTSRYRVWLRREAVAAPAP